VLTNKNLHDIINYKLRKEVMNMEKILQVKYYGGFGENVVETYYKKEDKYLCERYSS
jgi:hypothetical protein